MMRRCGTSMLIYDQTCAAEAPPAASAAPFPPAKRVFINEGGCAKAAAVQRRSNCVSIVPLETEFRP